MVWTVSFGIMLIYIQHKEEFEAQLPQREPRCWSFLSAPALACEKGGRVAGI